MATHKSALKAHRQSLKRRERNRQLRSQMRRALRSFRTAAGDGDTIKVAKALGSTVSWVDKLAGKGVIHANAAARHKSRLAKLMAKAELES